VELVFKNQRIAPDSAARRLVRMPGRAVQRRRYEQPSPRGWEECGTQALYRLYLAP